MFPYIATYLSSFAAAGLFGPMVPAALLGAGFSAGAIANAIAAQNTIRVIAPTFWGQLADRSHRPSAIAAASFFCAALCHLSILFADTPLPLILCYALLGFAGTSGTAIVDGLVLSALEQRAVERKRFGRIRVAGTIGFAVSTLLVGYFRTTGTLASITRPAVLLPSAVLMTIAAIMIATTHVQRATASERTPTRFTQLMQNRPYLLLVLFTFFHWASHATYTIFIVPLADARGLSPLAVAIAITLGLVVEGVLMHRSDRLLGSGSGKGALCFVAVIGAVRWLGFAVDFGSPALNTAAFLFFSACHGLSFGFFYPLIVNLVSGTVEEGQRHSALSVLVAMSFGLGGAAGAAAAGHLMEHFGVAATWAGMLPFSLLAICTALVIPTTTRPA
jgi:PPP family 3-phenylpropionic acid transporter